MEQNAASKNQDVMAEDYVEEVRLQLEEAADRLIGGSSGRTRIYSERALARKIRLEEKRLPKIEETALPDEAVNYLLDCHIELLIDSARLSRLQGAVLALVIHGWTPVGISENYDMSVHAVNRILRAARLKLSARHSPYEGLHEVYWQEVHRYVYRKHGQR